MAVSTESFEILRTLARHRVDFIVVGMTAAVLQGAPAFTFDLDIVYRIAEDNVQGLLNALGELEAEFRTDAANRHLSPNASHLMRPPPGYHRAARGGACAKTTSSTAEWTHRGPRTRTPAMGNPTSKLCELCGTDTSAGHHRSTAGSAAVVICKVCKLATTEVCRLADGSAWAGCENHHANKLPPTKRLPGTDEG